jgi:hypothetical protein
MRMFSSAAPREADKGLYKNASPGLLKLMKKSRQELRQKGRVEYVRAVEANQEATRTANA